MFNGAGDDVLPAALVCVSRALNRQVRRFRPAGSENNIIRRFRVDEFGELRAGFVEGVARAQAMSVQRGPAAKRFAEKWKHRLQRLCTDWRGRLMIEVNGRHGIGVSGRSEEG